MFDETAGMSGCLGLGLAALALVVAVVLGLGSLANGLQESAAAARHSEAALERAQAERAKIEAEAKAELAKIEAEAKLDMERIHGESWEHRFMLWTSFIEANDDDAPLVAGAILAAVLLFGGVVAGWTLAGKVRIG